MRLSKIRWGRTFFRTTSLGLLILAGGSRALSAQSPLSPEQIRKQNNEKELARWKSLLNEYHQGKRDDNDGSAILFNLLHYYGVTHSSTTAEAGQANKEWQALLVKHPEFMTHPPLHIHEEIEAQQARTKYAHEQAEKAAAFVPSDSMIKGIYGNGHKAVFVYQYHLEFYDLPPNLSFRPEPPPNSFYAGLYDGDRYVTPAEILKPEARFPKPLKTIRFAHRIRTSIYNVARDMELVKYFWVCEDLTMGYSASSDAEWEFTRRHARGLMPWIDEKADFENFCGALSLDGRIVYQLPIRQHLPDQLLVVASTNLDGTSALIKVGKEVLISDEDGEKTIPEAGDFGKFLIWTYPDKLANYAEQNHASLQQALDAAGLRMK